MGQKAFVRDKKRYWRARLHLKGPKRRAAPYDMCPTSNQRDIERLYISKLWNDLAHDLSENRTRAARELVNDRPARTLLLKNENSFFKSDKTDEYPLAHGPTMSVYMPSIWSSTDRVLSVYMPSILSSTSA
jgi:hypothetical protein